jgi:SAM-dependent methyltransferase
MQPVQAPGGVPTQRYALELDDAEVTRYRMMAAAAQEAESDLWVKAGIVAGARVADVGCGPGGMLPALSASVGPSGSVVGVDADDAALAAARGLISSAPLANATVQSGRADATGLPAGSFDVVMMRHVLAHNGGYEDAICGHLATLLCPGGTLYLVDVDGSAMRTLPEDPDLADLHARYRELLTGRGSDITAGLRLGERLERAGLDVVDFVGRYTIARIPAGVRPPPWAAREAMVDAGLATAADIERWAAAYERSDALEQRPTVFAPMFVALGRSHGE